MNYYTAIYKDELVKGRAQIFFNLTSKSPDFAYYIEQVRNELETEEALLALVQAHYPSAKLELAGRALVISVTPEELFFRQQREAVILGFGGKLEDQHAPSDHKADDSSPIEPIADPIEANDAIGDIVNVMRDALSPEPEHELSTPTLSEASISLEPTQAPETEPEAHQEPVKAEPEQATSEQTNQKSVYLLNSEDKVVTGTIVRKKIDANKQLLYAIKTEDGEEITRPKNEVYSTREEAESNVNTNFSYRYTFILKENFLNQWQERQEKFINQAHSYAELVQKRADLGRRYLHTQLEVVVMEAHKDAHKAEVLERVPYLKYKEEYRYKYFQ